MLQNRGLYGWGDVFPRPGEAERPCRLNDKLFHAQRDIFLQNPTRGRGELSRKNHRDFSHRFRGRHIGPVTRDNHTAPGQHPEGAVTREQTLQPCRSQPPTCRASNSAACLLQVARRGNSPADFFFMNWLLGGDYLAGKPRKLTVGQEMRR